MIDLKRFLDEALTIPADKAGPVELKLRDALTSNYKDFKYADTIVKCCRNDEKSGIIPEKNLRQTYVAGLGNIVDLLKSYDKCKSEYAKQKLNKKVQIQRTDGKMIELDPIKDFNKIGRLSALKQLIDKFENLVQNDETIPTSFKKYAITQEDRQFIRLICWNSRVMVWGTKKFEPSQKFAVQLWQNIETIDSGAAYGEPDKQCPYCTHAKNHWNEYSSGDENYEQYWYLAIPKGIECTKAGDLNTPEVVKIYNAMKGLGPKILVCQHDSSNDWCDRNDNPLDSYGIDIHRAKDASDELVFGPPNHDYYDDVIELYDRYFQQSSNLRRFEWETYTDYTNRGGRQKIVPKQDEEDKFDRQSEEFDLENDVWNHSINIDEKAFDKNGFLKIQLPKKIRQPITIKHATIKSLDGFPTWFIGPVAIVTFIDCKIKDVGDWKIEHHDDGLSLAFQSTVVDPSSGLDEAISGVDFKTILTYDINSIRKIRSVEQLNIIADSSVDFRSLKNVKIETDLVLSRDPYSNNVGGIEVKSFTGLNLSSVKELRLNNIIIKDIDSFTKLDFSNLEALKLKVANKDVLERRQIFRTVVRKTSSSCNVQYSESKTISVKHETPSIQDILNDTSESWFEGLPFKSERFAIERMDFSDSPRKKFEYYAWRNGQGSSAVFQSSKIPLLKILNENPDELFKITASTGNGNFYGMYFGIVQNDSIVCISEKDGSVVDCNFQCDYKIISFKCDAPETLDKALKAFLKDRKTVFKQITGLMIPVGFKGTSIYGINDPELALYFQVVYDKTDYSKQASVLNNLKAIQNCNVKAIYSSSNRRNEVIVKNCVIGEKIEICAQRFENCVIGGKNTCSSYSIQATDGLYGCSFTAPVDTLSICAKTIQNCSFDASELVLKDVESISGTQFKMQCLKLHDNGTKITSSLFSVVKKNDDTELHVLSTGNHDCTNLAAAIVAGLSQNSKIQTLLFTGKISSLDFLDNLKCKIDYLELENLAHCESFEFKLKKPNLIGSLVASGIESNTSCETLAGFDASTPLALEMVGSTNSKNPLVIQYLKYFTEQRDKYVDSATVPEKYVKDGRFQPQMTSLDEQFWLGILKLID